MVANGCAAIAGGGTSQAVSISSIPDGAHFVVKSSSGLQMAAGDTPQTVRLPRKNEYQIEISVDGYKSQSVVLTKSLNGWIWGNLLIGWLIGFIVDFASGAAYKLEPAQVQVTLQTASAHGSNDVFALVQFMADNGEVVASKLVELEPQSSSIPAH